MSRQMPVQELGEGLDTPRRSSRIAAVGTRRASTEESATPAKAAKSRRLSSSQEVEENAKKDDNVGTPSRITRRTSINKSPTPTEENKNVPVRRSTRRASTSSLTEEIQRSESPALTTRRRSARSMSISPTSDLAVKVGTPRKSTRSVSSSPVPPPKLRGRRSSVTEKVVALEAIEESDLKNEETPVSNDVEKMDYEEIEEEVEVLSKKKKAVAKHNLQTILEKSITEEPNKIEEDKTINIDELKSKSDHNEEPTEKNLEEINSDQQDTPQPKLKSSRLSLSLSKNKSDLEEDLTDTEAELQTTNTDESERKNEHKEESPKKNVNQVTTDQQDTSEPKLKSPKVSPNLTKDESGSEKDIKDAETEGQLKQSPRRSSRLSSSTEKPSTSAKILQDSVENSEASINLNLNLSEFNTSKDSFSAKEVSQENVNTSSSSDKENLSKETNENPENCFKKKLIVLADRLDLSQTQEQLRNSITNKSKQNSFYEPMDVDEYSFNVSVKIEKDPKLDKFVEESLTVLNASNKTDFDQSLSKSSEMQVQNDSKLEKASKSPPKTLEESHLTIFNISVERKTDLNQSILSKSEIKSENESILDKSSKSPRKSIEKPSSVLITNSPERNVNKSETSLKLGETETQNKPSTSSASAFPITSPVLSDTRNGKSPKKINSEPSISKTGENSIESSETSKAESLQVSKLLNNSGKRKSSSPIRKTLESDGDKSSLQTSKVKENSETCKTAESNEDGSADQEGVIILETDLKNPRRKSLRLFNTSTEKEIGLAYSTPKHKSKLDTTNENLNQNSLEEQEIKSLNVSNISNKSDLGSFTSKQESKMDVELLNDTNEGSVNRNEKSNKSLTDQESEDVLTIDLENTSKEQDQNKGQLNTSNKVTGHSMNSPPVKENESNNLVEANTKDIKITRNPKSPKEKMDIAKKQNTTTKSIDESRTHISNTKLTYSDSEGEEDIDDDDIELKFSEESDNEDEVILQNTSKKGEKNGDSSLKDVEAKIISLIKNQESSDDEESEVSATDFLDNMLEEGEEDTPSEGSNDIVDHGEPVGSSESEISSDDTYENDSFIDDDVDDQLLSGDEYDLENEKVKKTDMKEKHKKKRIIQIPDSEEDEKQGNTDKLEENPASEAKAKINGIEEDSDLEKMSTQPYCGLTPPSIVSRESLSGSEKGDLPKVVASSTVINKKDNLRSLEELKHHAPKITECITLKTSSSLTNSPHYLPDKTFTPNNSTLDESDKSGRQRHSSITIQENIKLQDLEEGTIKDRISKVVNVFCNSVKEDKTDLTGNISLNISVEYLQNTDALKQGNQFPKVDILAENIQSTEIIRTSKSPIAKKLDLSRSKQSSSQCTSLVDSWVTLSEDEDDTNAAMKEKPKKKLKKKKQVTEKEEETSDLDLSLDIDTELNKKYPSTSNDTVATETLKGIPAVKTSKKKILETTADVVTENKQENETGKTKIKKRKRDKSQTSVEECLENETVSKKKKRKLKKNKTDSEKLEYNVNTLENLLDEIPPMQDKQKQNKKVKKSKSETSKLEPTKKKSKIICDKSGSSDLYLCEPLSSNVQYLPSTILGPLIKNEKTNKTSDGKPKKPKLLPSTSTDSNDWKIETLASKPSKKKQQQSVVEKFHAKDFKNRMLFDQARVNRTDTKTLLKKKQKIKA